MRYTTDEPDAPPLRSTHAIYEDADLWPIRDPGDDAVDKTLQPREVMA